MHRALLAIALLAATPSTAWPCFNEVMLRGNEAVQTIARAEAFLERGKYRAALGTLHEVAFESGQLSARAADVRAIYAMRMKTKRANVRWVINHFKARSKANKQDIRLRARLAEAYEANDQDDLARQILVELQAKDLIPDAFAFRTLARVTDGSERQDALLACGVRAKNKSICTAPTKPRG